MRVIKQIDEMKVVSSDARKDGKKIGFVPTMGALHKGQLSLVDIAKKETNFVVVSIFVNPLQFGPGEDFRSYPRNLASDATLLKSRGVDILFAPELSEMYPDSYDTEIKVPGLSSVLCGKTRPGHFKGVCTVVCKLFNIVTPDVAVFGEKDAQQAIIIERMTRDLNLGIRILTGPTIREPDGLAMSSRNVYLTKEQRGDAAVLYQALLSAKKLVQNGEKDANKIKKEIENIVSKKPTAKIDYIDIVRKSDLKPIKNLAVLGGSVRGPKQSSRHSQDGCATNAKGPTDELLIAIAVWFGKARLIDNIIIQIS